MYLTQHNAGNEGGTLQNTSSRAGPRKLNPILTFMVVDNSDIPMTHGTTGGSRGGIRIWISTQSSYPEFKLSDT